MSAPTMFSMSSGFCFNLSKGGHGGLPQMMMSALLFEKGIAWGRTGALKKWPPPCSPGQELLAGPPGRRRLAAMSSSRRPARCQGRDGAVEFDSDGASSHEEYVPRSCKKSQQHLVANGTKRFMSPR